MENIDNIEVEDGLERLKSTHIANIVLVGMVVVMLVFGIYLLFFWQHKFSSDPAAWGQFGDFIGGTANPILSFITLVLLAFTLSVQNRQLNVSARQLELSRKELELTRKELQRAAYAQELSEKALKAQAESALIAAKLAGYNGLLTHYRERFHQLEDDKSNNGLKIKSELSNRIKDISTKIDKEFVTLDSIKLVND